MYTSHPSMATPDYSFFQRIPLASGHLVKRFIRTMNTLARQPGMLISAASQDAAEAKAIYRLLKNSQLTEEVVLQTYRQETLRQMKATGESVFLCVQDTTEIDYGARAKTTGLGEFRSSKSKGLLAHSALVLTPSGLPLGVLHQKIWARDPALKGERQVSRPYEEKESYKWTESAKASMHDLPASTRLIQIGDREADFFEFLHTLEEDGQSYVVRSVQNRITETDGERMWDHVRAQEESARIVVSLPRDTHREKPARETTLAIRYVSDTAQVPGHLKRKKAGYMPLTCSLIHVVEVTPLPDQEPIEWFLVTNLPLADGAAACEKVGWYVRRWQIERFHYILKSRCGVEKLQQRDANALRKLILMYSIIAVDLQRLTYLARLDPDAPCTQAMSEEEWHVLYRIVHQTKQLPAQPLPCARWSGP
ncbi:IS4 family transposase [Paenibacillus sabuli]|uniref:IS4 family transposase n=1 Tax=Paenibacillus sabuli TaxID=2772509 RepID=UPI001CC2F4C8|nr:IS4 family transposase [Paenibacillus sabuli]